MSLGRPKSCLKRFAFTLNKRPKRPSKRFWLRMAFLFQRRIASGSCWIFSHKVCFPRPRCKTRPVSDYAVVSRYPGDFEPIDETEYQDAIRLAQAVVSWSEEIIEKRTT